jgi:NADH:ubiquinone oxidoreductase subunit D
MVEEIGSTAAGDIIINVGPQHPATHGVLHLVITINGETIPIPVTGGRMMITDERITAS